MPFPDLGFKQALDQNRMWWVNQEPMFPARDGSAQQGGLPLWSGFVGGSSGASFRAPGGWIWFTGRGVAEPWFIVLD